MIQYRIQGKGSGKAASNKVVAGEVVVVYRNQRIQYENHRVVSYEVNEKRAIKTEVHHGDGKFKIASVLPIHANVKGVRW